MPNKIVAEADELAYAAAFSCQTVAYKTLYNDGTIEDHDKEFTATQLKNKHKDEKNLDINQDYTLERYLILDEPQLVVLNLTTMVKKLWTLHMHRDAYKFGVTPIKEVNLWLSPSDGSNFRYSVINTAGKRGLGYKAGRPEKPHYLPLAKECLKNMFGAREILGYEADDACSMYQTDETILCSKDKDLNMIEGLHFNMMYDEFFNVEKGGIGEYIVKEKNKIECRGLLAFYQQLLTGDATDNVPGCGNPMKANYKIPPSFTIKTAVDYLKDCNTEQELLKKVISAYKIYYGNSWHAVLLEISDLVWMVRTENERGSHYVKKIMSGDYNYDI